MTTLEPAESFLQYVKDCPGQRFWQAFSNFTKQNFIFVKDTLEEEGQDTFYMQNNRVIKKDKES